MTREELLDRAHEAMENSYSPYSHYKVGAALETADGSVYTGCNIENSSYGATICAERTAAVKAVSDGHREIVRLAVVSSSDEFTYPCGICRQFLTEFMKPEAEVYFKDKEHGIMTVPFGVLVPFAFTSSDIK